MFYKVHDVRRAARNPFRTFPATSATAIALATLADWLFYDHALGGNLALFGAALLCAILLKGGRRDARGPAAALSLLAVALVVSVALQPGALNVALLSVALMSVAMTLHDGWSAQLPTWLERWGWMALAGWTIFFRDYLSIMLSARMWRFPLVVRFLSICRRWILPVVLSLVFVMLFTAANPLLDRFVETLLTGYVELMVRWLEDAFVIVLENILTARGMLWAVFAMGAWVFLRYRSKVLDHLAWRESDAPSSSLLSVAMVRRCLLSFNFVFLVQTSMDLLYLWGGRALPDDMTYAEYAQRGAYPLVATALLAAAFVLATFRPRSETGADPGVRSLVYLWIGQNVFLTLSSIWRLWLYVEAYSLTRWRLAAGAWMALVAFGLATIIVRISRDRNNTWLLHANFLATVAVLLVFCFVDSGAVAAKYNVRHCREAGGGGQSLDVEYLHLIGPSSLPACEWGLAHLQHPGVREELKAVMAVNREYLNRMKRDWRTLTIRRHRLAARYCRE